MRTPRRSATGTELVVPLDERSFPIISLPGATLTPDRAAGGIATPLSGTTAVSNARAIVPSNTQVFHPRMETAPPTPQPGGGEGVRVGGVGRGVGGAGGCGGACGGGGTRRVATSLNGVGGVGLRGDCSSGRGGGNGVGAGLGAGEVKTMLHHGLGVCGESPVVIDESRPFGPAGFLTRATGTSWPRLPNVHGPLGLTVGGEPVPGAISCEGSTTNGLAVCVGGGDVRVERRTGAGIRVEWRGFCVGPMMGGAAVGGMRGNGAGGRVRG